MSRNIKIIGKDSARSFTLIEVMTTSFIAIYVMLSAYGVYMMAWKWWYETSPVIESQRVARIALQTIVEGMIDTTAGQDSVSGTTYRRRSGIAFSTLTNANPTPSTPVISADSRRIDFRLEPDTTNTRAFYIATDGATGNKALFYKDNTVVARKVPGTEIDPDLGDVRLTFQSVAGYSNLIKVTVNVDRTVYGVRKDPYQIAIQYDDFVFLRNV